MKFRDPKTGEVFEDIRGAQAIFCAKHRADCRRCFLREYVGNVPCFTWCKEHQEEADRLMGYEVIESEEESEDGVQIRAKVKTKVKEVNMERKDKPLSEKKKLFISQPMRGKADDEILAERSNAIQAAKDYTGEDIDVLDTFFRDFDGNALQFLAKSIEKLAEADIAYFVPDWKDARGCRIEHECAKEYGIEIIEPVEVSKPAKPRLAEVLGVEVGQKFSIKTNYGVSDEFYISESGFLRDVSERVSMDAYCVCYAINHPDSIIRAPRLTEAELERCRVFGVKYLTRNGGKAIVHMWDNVPDVLEDDEGKYYIIGNSGARDLGGVDFGFFPSVEPDGCICVEGAGK